MTRFKDLPKFQALDEAEGKATPGDNSIIFNPTHRSFLVGRAWGGKFVSLGTFEKPVWHEDHVKGEESAENNARFFLQSLNTTRPVLDALEVALEAIKEAPHSSPDCGFYTTRGEVCKCWKVQTLTRIKELGGGR